MKLLLAPMEGVLDAPMRDLLTGVGGYDLCVTEFVRVVDRPLPDRVFRRLCPELTTGGRTAAGTPVVVQLLGSDPEALAANAARLAQLGAPGVDLNFGCPSRFVNRNGGGAVLLREPERIGDIVAAVRAALPEAIPLSAKIRLGFEDTAPALETARAVEEAGAALLTVHARTRDDGYRAPARWEWLARIRETVELPVVANGDIHSAEDYQRCREISGCADAMLARGAVARPDLARLIRAHHAGEAPKGMEWGEVAQLIRTMAGALAPTHTDRNLASRLKQWLAMLKREYSEAHHCFERIRELRRYSEIEPLLEG